MSKLFASMQEQKNTAKYKCFEFVFNNFQIKTFFNFGGKIITIKILTWKIAFDPELLAVVSK